MDGGFVKIAKFSTPFAAHLVVGRLAAEGIRAVAVDDTIEGSPAGTNLWVPAETVERALDVVSRPEVEDPEGATPDEAGEEIEGFDDPDDDEAEDPDDDEPPPAPGAVVARCPACGSTDIEEEMRLLPFLPAKRRCLRCR